MPQSLRDEVLNTKEQEPNVPGSIRQSVSSGLVGFGIGLLGTAVEQYTGTEGAGEAAREVGQDVSQRMRTAWWTQEASIVAKAEGQQYAEASKKTFLDGQKEINTLMAKGD